MLIVLLFTVGISALRFTWNHAFYKEESIESPNGELDARGWSFDSQDTLLLDGEWRFYPNQLVNPSEAPSSYDLVNGDEAWDLGTGSMYGYGTYAMTIQLDEDIKELLALYISELNAASRIYVNGEELYSSGNVSRSLENFESGERPEIVRFEASPEHKVDIVVQVANFENPRNGGMVVPLRFGSADAITANLNMEIGLTILAVTIYLLHAIYAILFYFLVKPTKRDIRWLYFSLILLLITLATLLTERIFLMMEVLSLEWNHRLINIGVLLGALFLVELLKNQRPTSRRSFFYLVYQAIATIFLVVGIFSPLPFVLQVQAYMALIALIPFLHALKIFYQYLRNMSKDSIFLFLALWASLVSFVWLLVIVRLNLDQKTYPFDLLIALLLVVIYFYRQYFRVVEERSQLTNELHEINAAKDSFLKMVAYELQNPVRVIRNHAASLLTPKEEPLPLSALQEVQQIEAMGNKLSSMLDDMLELERLADKKLVLNKSAVSLPAVAKAVLDAHHYLVDGDRVKLLIEMPNDLPPIYADEKRLTQILSNLVMNAGIFTDKGIISIQARLYPPFVQIAVYDTGKPIPEEELSTIFQPSAWRKDSAKQDKEGLGLILYIVKALVELHGSSIHVSSNNQKGTTLSFMLPLHENAQKSEVVNSEPVAPTVHSVMPNILEYPEGRTRILLVEDHYPIKRVLKSYFDPFIYEVYTAETGNEALQLLDKKTMDLVLIDSSLPDLSGYEVTKRIRENFTMSELPILLILSYSTEETRRAAFEAGVNDSITSPIDSVELLSRIRTLLSMKKAIEQRLSLEAAWLHAQIRPHFLINTFLSIAALGRIDINRMDALIHELSTYIRLSIDFQNEQEESLVERELELVRAYLAIQKERFGDRVQVKWEVEEVSCVKIPPLTIQSLVENAVSHGVLGRETGGTVTIRISKDANGTCFTVLDDGVGMSPDYLSSLLDSKVGWYKNQGVGLVNTNRRLKQRYGKGLTIESCEGAGTSVSFCIPHSDHLL